MSDQTPQAPIALLTVDEAGEVAGVMMFAPGLPPGDHRLYVDPWEGWQPMETCPPYPTRVLLWHPELGYAVTGWAEAYGYKTGSWKPAFWMPLPAPPRLPDQPEGERRG